MNTAEPVLAELPTEGRNAASAHLDQLPTAEMLAVLHAEDTVAAQAVTAALPMIAAAVEAVTARLQRGGRLFYLGAGTSGRLGVLDASECPPTFSVSPRLFVGLIAGGDSALRRSSEGAEDSFEQGELDLAEHHPRPEDAVLGIAASGRTPWVLGGLALAQRTGSLTLGLTCARQPGVNDAAVSPIGQAVELAMELATGPEALTGSTRLKAGTATKMVLNLLSTGVMVRMGAVFGNLMVNVQPTNAKLVDRAERILVKATGCTRERAAELLREARAYLAGEEQAVGPVKLAIAMELLGLSLAEAAARLKAAGGRLGDALKAACP